MYVDISTIFSELETRAEESQSRLKLNTFHIWHMKLVARKLYTIALFYTYNTVRVTFQAM